MTFGKPNTRRKYYESFIWNQFRFAQKSSAHFQSEVERPFFWWDATIGFSGRFFWVEPMAARKHKMHKKAEDEEENLCQVIYLKICADTRKMFYFKKGTEKLAFICFQTLKWGLIVFNLQIFLFIVKKDISVLPALRLTIKAFNTIHYSTQENCQKFAKEESQCRLDF